ncbi:hypothetical protein FJTKL_13044 [Diaporthe vaccinii]|uniref:Major facilitator superfamily (MFS) profile domain-containing protein n=1 Tax=Diaporthe vaccinii TaxID=105482 RepID=A0ABR4EBQ4_9PEZI
MQSLGQLIGMLLLNPISDRIGRKVTLYVLWVLLAGSLLFETFARDWRDWTGAKVLAGVGVGAIQSTLPVYITEWSPADIRGAMVLVYSGHTRPLQDFLIFVACLWTLGNNALGQLGWAFVGEVASQRLRARTAGLAAAMSVVFGLTFNTAVPVMLDTEGADWGYDTAWLFFGLGSLVCVMVWFYVPEPSQRNYAEMDEMYTNGVPARKMRKYVTEVQLAQQQQIVAAEKLQ